MARYRKLFLLVILLSLAFDLVIALDLVPCLRGPAPWPPEWQHPYRYRGTWYKVWLPIIFFSALILLLVKPAFSSWRPSRRIGLFLLLILLGLCLQLSIMFLGEHGAQGPIFASLIHPWRTGYVQQATTVDNFTDFLATYTENLPAYHQRVRTHPPGPTWFFWLPTELAKRSPTICSWGLSIMRRCGMNIAALQEKYPNEWIFGGIVAMYAILLFSSLAIVPLYWLAKLFLGDKTKALYLSVTILLLPANLVGIANFDQLFPFWVLLTIYAAIVAINKRSAIYSILAGLLSALLIFFSFGLLFIIALIAIFIFIETFPARGEAVKIKIKRCASLLAPYLIGLVLPYIILKTLYGYDFIENYRLGLQYHMEDLTYKRSYLLWLFFNFVDFFIYLGIPMAILFFAGLRNTIKKPLSLLGRFTIIFVCLLLFLDLSGSVRGETGRIWIFLMPLCLLIAGNLNRSDPTSTRRLFLITYCLLFLQNIFMREFWSQLI